MTPQLGASLENIYSTGITHDDRDIFLVHVTSGIFTKDLPIILRVT